MLRSHKVIPPLVCGEDTQVETDVCLQTYNQILIVTQEDKSRPLRRSRAQARGQGNCCIPVQKLSNKRTRQERDRILGLPGSHYARRVYPTFYKVTVTRALGRAIVHGYTPDFETVVDRFRSGNYLRERHYSDGK